jgi:MFS family permease
VSLFGLFSSAGPLIGGALTEDTTWRWCFWMYVFAYSTYISELKAYPDIATCLWAVPFSPLFSYFCSFTASTIPLANFHSLSK